MQYINMVEPLAICITKNKQNGSKITVLAIMSIINMCNFTEDIKSIFLQKNGLNLIIELLDSKDDGLLLNTLRLLLVIIT